MAMTDKDWLSIIMLTAAHEGFSPKLKKQWDGRPGIGYGMQPHHLLPEDANKTEMSRDRALFYLYRILKHDGDAALEGIRKNYGVKSLSPRAEGVIRMLAYNAGPNFYKYSKVANVIKEYVINGQTQNEEKKMMERIANTLNTVNGKKHPVLAKRRMEELEWYNSGNIARTEKDVSKDDYLNMLRAQGIQLSVDEKEEKKGGENKKDGGINMQIEEKEVPGGRMVTALGVYKQPSAIEKIKEKFPFMDPVEEMNKLYKRIFSTPSKDDLQKALEKYKVPADYGERAEKFITELKKDTDAYKEALKLFSKE